MKQVNGAAQVTTLACPRSAEDALSLSIEAIIGRWKKSSREPVCAYIYDLDGIAGHVREMASLLPESVRLFYAIKANPDKRIIEALLPHVAGFEVASAGELAIVRSVSENVPVLFGGPGKKDSELEAAIRQNVAYIHVESLLELRKLMELAERHSRQVQVLLRVNLRTDDLPQTVIAMGGRPSPFGLDEPLIEEAIGLLQQKDNSFVALHGFHFHSLSNQLDADLHADMVRYYVRKVGEWKERYRLDISVVNAGGGFGVSYTDGRRFDWARFASLLSESMDWKKLGDSTLLYFEPGRFVSAEHGYYAAEVVDIKTSQSKHFAVVRGGTHHNRLPASWGHDQPFVVVPSDVWTYGFDRPTVANDSVTIVGELCTPKDKLHADVGLERLRVGDVIVFQKCGAYCWTISHHDFLGHPHPAFYYLTEGDMDGSGDRA